MTSSHVRSRRQTQQQQSRRQQQQQQRRQCNSSDEDDEEYGLARGPTSVLHAASGTVSTRLVVW